MFIISWKINAICCSADLNTGAWIMYICCKALHHTLQQLPCNFPAVKLFIIMKDQCNMLLCWSEHRRTNYVHISVLFTCPTLLGRICLVKSVPLMFVTMSSVFQLCLYTLHHPSLGSHPSASQNCLGGLTGGVGTLEQHVLSHVQVRLQSTPITSQQSKILPHVFNRKREKTALRATNFAVNNSSLIWEANWVMIIKIING